MTRRERITIAAWIDGEGCISVRRSSTNRAESYYLAVVIGQRNRKPLAWIQKRTGGSLTQGKRGSWALQISSRQALKVLEECLPFFLAKQDQALLGIELARGKGRSGRNTKDPNQLSREREIKEELSKAKRRYNSGF